MDQQRLGDVDELSKLAIEAGVKGGTKEHLAVGILFRDEVMTRLFLSYETSSRKTPIHQDIH